MSSKREAHLLLLLLDFVFFSLSFGRSLLAILYLYSSYIRASLSVSLTTASSASSSVILKTLVMAASSSRMAPRFPSLMVISGRHFYLAAAEELRMVADKIG